MAIQMGVNIEVIGTTWLYRWVLMSQCKVYTNEITTQQIYILHSITGTFFASSIIAYWRKYASNKGKPAV